MGTPPQPLACQCAAPASERPSARLRCLLSTSRHGARTQMLQRHSPTAAIVPLGSHPAADVQAMSGNRVSGYGDGQMFSPVHRATSISICPEATAKTRALPDPPDVACRAGRQRQPPCRAQHAMSLPAPHPSACRRDHVSQAQRACPLSTFSNSAASMPRGRRCVCADLAPEEKHCHMWRGCCLLEEALRCLTQGAPTKGAAQDIFEELRRLRLQR